MDSRYPYDGFYKLKPSVLERDHYTCQWCGKKLGDSIISYALRRGRYEHILSEVDFTVHHKDGNKSNNTMENLVTVCNSCHASHHRRKETREKSQTDKWRRNYYTQKSKGNKNLQKKT
jgi:5-methylcytosine-specific restriction endonuclease McrA